MCVPEAGREKTMINTRCAHILGIKPYALTLAKLLTNEQVSLRKAEEIMPFFNKNNAIYTAL
jgi:hypothetical protein